MNFQTAAIVGGAAFLLSSLAGLIGGVPFFDVLVRAFFWGGAGFGLSLGIEMLMRTLLPDLFVPSESTEETKEDVPERRVDITLDDEKGDVFEEVDEDDEPAPRKRAPVIAASENPQPEVEVPASAVADVPVESDEEMPEIGAFLDAFKPNASEDQGEEGAAAPEYAEYAPVEQSDRSSSREVTIDGEAQDPVILAKAIQTVMKRDGQGS